jgi:hypothetical protein
MVKKKGSKKSARKRTTKRKTHSRKKATKRKVHRKPVKRKATRKRTVKRKTTKRASPKRKTATKTKKSYSKSIRPIRIHSAPIKLKLDVFALAYALAFLRVLLLLIITIFSKMGRADGLSEFAQKIHFTYSLSTAGIVAGLAETAVWGLVMGLVIGWIYNKFA